MISISMKTADLNGHVEFEDGTSDFGGIPARVSRAATLDGGSVVVNSGVSHGDRTFTLKTEIDEQQRATLEHIQEAASLINVSCREGFFSGAISYVDAESPNLNATILIKSKDS